MRCGEMPFAEGLIDETLHVEALHIDIREGEGPIVRLLVLRLLVVRMLVVRLPIATMPAAYCSC
jgi:hypothetical protein